MSYNGSGTFNINSTGQPVVAGTVITASAFNALTTDLATGLTTAITKDGQTTTTARITFAQGITSSLVTDSSSVSTGSIITAGGAGIAKNLYVGVNANVAGTLGVTGVATFSAAPIYSSLTASSAVATDASKGLVSVTNTGTGNNVLGTSPTIATPTITGDASISGLTVGKGGGAVSTNTAVGASALNANTTGSLSVAIGTSALAANTTSDANTAVGYQAASTQTTGALYTTAFGYQSLKANTSGAQNNALGFQSLTANTTGANNSGFGTLALAGNTTGSTNTAFGNEALRSNTTFSFNTAVGYQSLTANAVSGNTATGYQSMLATTTGTSNAAFGLWTLKANTTGQFNTAIGDQALLANTTASNNTAVGYQSGKSLTTGANNTYLGYGAANGISTGSNNVCIGYDVNNTGQVSNTITITTRGASDKGSSTGYIDPNGGGVYQGNNSAAWSVASDRRLKKNIVDNTEGLDIISQIRVRNFEYRLPEEVTELPANQAIQKQGVQLGVIAQELQEVCSDCVKEETTGVLSVNSDNLTWHMINAIKDLKALVDAQATEITALKAKVGI